MRQYKILHCDHFLEILVFLQFIQSNVFCVNFKVTSRSKNILRNHQVNIKEEMEHSMTSPKINQQYL